MLVLVLHKCKARVRVTAKVKRSMGIVIFAVYTDINKVHVGRRQNILKVKVKVKVRMDLRGMITVSDMVRDMDTHKVRHHGMVKVMVRDSRDIINGGKKLTA